MREVFAGLGPKDRAGLRESVKDRPLQRKGRAQILLQNYSGIFLRFFFSLVLSLPLL